MRALAVAAHAAWSFVDVSKIKRACAIAATVVATATFVLLASFVAVAIGLS
jgi:hypothetical protein